jgi:hypothetical protein
MVLVRNDLSLGRRPCSCLILPMSIGRACAVNHPMVATTLQETHHPGIADTSACAGSS